MLRAKPKIISPPRLLTSCSALPPEGAVRLWPGKAGSTAPLEWIGSAAAGSNLFASRGRGTGFARPQAQRPTEGASLQPKCPHRRPGARISRCIDGPHAPVGSAGCQRHRVL